MPSIASITVKKSDGTTDIVYDALSGSGGDSSPAVWRQDTGVTAGLPAGLRKVLKMLTKWNGPKTARQVQYDYTYPYAVQDSTTTVFSSKDRVVFNGIMTCPQNVPSNEITEACHQFANLMASALIKQSAASGYAPT
jgi:hypothetical protein